MRTIDTPSSQDRGWWVKLRSDVSLLARLIRMTIAYSTAGRRVRRLYRRAEARGETFWVDDPAETARPSP